MRYYCLLLVFLSLFSVCYCKCDNRTDVYSLVASRWETVTESDDTIQCLAEAMYQRGDCIRVFLFIYREVTSSIREAIEHKQFENNTWMEEVRSTFIILSVLSTSLSLRIITEWD